MPTWNFYLATIMEACTLCRLTPYRSATSVSGTPTLTSRTARYLCSVTLSSHSTKRERHASSGATVSHIKRRRTRMDARVDARVIRQQMCDACLPVDVRHMV
jgi:hypothetical protein